MKKNDTPTVCACASMQKFNVIGSYISGRGWLKKKNNKNKKINHERKKKKEK